MVSQMIDWMFILILVLAIGLIVIQDMIIKSKDKTLKTYRELFILMEPILAAIVAAQEEALNKKKKVDL